MSLILTSCESQPASNPLPISTPVEFTPETALVIRTDLSYTAVQFAEVVPRVVQKLTFGLSGTLTEIHAGMHDFVRQGEVLAELDPADYLAHIERNEINMQILEIRKQQRDYDSLSSEYSLIDAREAYNLARRRGNRDIINRRQLSLRRLELSAELSKLNDMLFELDYEKAYEEHALLLSNFDRTTLVAPTDGYILFDTTLDIGDNVEANAEVFSFVSTSDILLHITSREAVHFQGQENMNVTIDDETYRASSYTPVRGDTIWRSDIPLTQAFLAFRFPPMYVQADSTVSTKILLERANTLAIPRRSIRTFAGDTSVDVLDGDLIVNVPVELGIVDGGLVEVISGLSEGDVVIIG